MLMIQDDEKIKFLLDLKNDLINNNLLHENKLYREFISNSEFVCFV